VALTAVWNLALCYLSILIILGWFHC
jgi:hypothetical protein